MDQENNPEKLLKLLVADDCEHTRSLVDIALADGSYDVEFAETGEQAIEACQNKFPDLAILDVQMPGATGIEVCQWIKENQGSQFTPVILLTSQSELVDKVNGLNFGADEYITKPFALAELNARVNALLRIKDLTDRLYETKTQLARKEKQLVTVQVAGAAAHELGQPLTAILLNCELLSKLDQRDQRFENVLTAIQEQCNTMRLILNRLNKVKDYKIKNYLGKTDILDIDSDESIG